SWAGQTLTASAVPTRRLSVQYGMTASRSCTVPVAVPAIAVSGPSFAYRIVDGPTASTTATSSKLGSSDSCTSIMSPTWTLSVDATVSVTTPSARDASVMSVRVSRAGND